MLPGAEFHAGLVVSEKVEDHRAGLHLLPARREHEETEPDRLQHGGGRDRVRTPAPAHALPVVLTPVLLMAPPGACSPVV